MRLSHIANRYLPQRARRMARTGFVWVKNLVDHLDPHYIQAITVEISTACNRRCVYCPVALHSRKQEIIDPETFGLILARIREIDWAGPLDFIHYNEPLLVPNIVQLVAQAHATCPYAELMLTTNGDRLTADLVTTLIAAGISQFNVTRHPPYSAGWDHRIGELRAQFPDHIHFLMSPGDEGWTNRGGLVTPPGPILVQSHCLSPQNLVITIDAKVVLCCNDFFKVHVIADLRERCIHDIYYGDFADIRRNLRKGKIDLDICRRCLGAVPVSITDPSPVVGHSTSSLALAPVSAAAFNPSTCS